MASRAASSACTSFGSKPSGGNTLGVVNTGRRRNARMPVSFSTRSSFFSRATFCWRAVALARRRSARASGLCTFDTARRKRLRSASGSAASSSPILRDGVEHVGRGLELLARQRARFRRRAGGGHVSSVPRSAFLCGLPGTAAVEPPVSAAASRAASARGFCSAVSAMRRRQASVSASPTSLLVGRGQLDARGARHAPTRRIRARTRRAPRRRSAPDPRATATTSRGAKPVLQRGEDLAADAEVGMAHVRGFDHPVECQNHAAIVVGGHARLRPRGTAALPTGSAPPARPPRRPARPRAPPSAGA